MSFGNFLSNKIPENVKEVTFIHNSFHNFPNPYNDMMTFGFMRVMLNQLYSNVNVGHALIENDNTNELEYVPEYTIINEGDEYMTDHEKKENEFIYHIDENEEISVHGLIIKRTTNWKEKVYESKIFNHEDRALINLTTLTGESQYILFYAQEDFNPDDKGKFEYQRLDLMVIMKDLEIDKLHIVIEPNYTEENQIITYSNKTDFIPDLVKVHSIFSHKPKTFLINPLEYYKLLHIYES